MSQFIHARHKPTVPLPDAMGHQFGVDLFCTHKGCDMSWQRQRDFQRRCFFTAGCDEDAPSCVKMTPHATVHEIVAMRVDGCTMDAISKETGVPRSRVSGILEFEMPRRESCTTQ